MSKKRVLFHLAKASSTTLRCSLYHSGHPETQRVPKNISFSTSPSVSEDAQSRWMENFKIFNEKSGKFRVAVVNVCNFNCFFCHNEGMENPRKQGEPGLKRKGPSIMSKEQLLGVMNAFTKLGGKQINITGGEPLARKDIVELLSSIDKRNTKIILNSNILLAERLLKAPKVDNVDAIYASLHTTDAAHFKEQLGTAASSAQRVMENMVLLKKHGYRVQINYSLGSYNKNEFGNVLDFALANEIDIKAIAVIRPVETPDFYGGEWIDPKWVENVIEARPVQKTGSKDGFGGKSQSWSTRTKNGVTNIEVKNIATGRLVTDYCNGCKYSKLCGEGIYALRSGVDGIWKPCLLNREKYGSIDLSGNVSYEEQILQWIDKMVGNWSNAKFVGGAPM